MDLQLFLASMPTDQPVVIVMNDNNPYGKPNKELTYGTNAEVFNILYGNTICEVDRPEYEVIKFYIDYSYDLPQDVLVIQVI